MLNHLLDLYPYQGLFVSLTVLFTVAITLVYIALGDKEPS